MNDPIGPDKEAQIAKQVEFVEWLKARGMYNIYASAEVMRYSHRVWEESQKSTADELLDRYAAAYEAEHGHLPLIMGQEVYVYGGELVEVFSVDDVDDFPDTEVGVSSTLEICPGEYENRVAMWSTRFSELAWRKAI